MDAERISNLLGSPQVSFVNAPKPWTCAIARSERVVGENGRLRHAAFCLSALAPNPYFGQVSAGTPLVDEELAHLFGAVGRPIVREGVPVNIANVARSAGADKSDWHNWALLLVPIDEFASGQRLSDAPAGGCETCHPLVCSAP